MTFLPTVGGFDLKTILTATDLSERSARALRQATHLALHHNAALHVLHIVDDEIPSRIAAEIKSAARENLTEQIALIAKGKALDVTVHVDFKPTWEGIVQAAERTGAEMLILGSHRSRGIMELFRGTTVERVAKVIRIPLLVVNNPVPGAYGEVIVGVDFSDCARHAIRLASTLAPKQALTLINAYHIPFKGFTQRADSDGSILKKDLQLIERELTQDMTAFEQGLENKSLRLKHVFAEGGPAQVLLHEAETRGADLICVGSHGRSWLAEAFLGSTARELLSAATCDVLIAPL